MSTTTLAAGAATPAVGRPDAPTAHLILPADASREEWLTVRRAGIGGSDVAAILGLDDYRGPLKVWEEKAGYQEPENDRMRWGTRLEGVIAEGFEEETGLATAIPAGTFAHLDRPWALVNIDRHVLDETGAVVAALELKNKSEYVAKKWEGNDEAPDAPALQAHWATAVGGYSHSYVAALLGGNRLTVFRQERNEELIAELFRICGEWYQRHIIEGVRPPADGAKGTKDFLAALYEVKPEAIKEIPLDEAKALRARRASLKDQAKALEDQLTEVENQMRDTAGSNAVVKSGKGVAWTWKPTGRFSDKQFRELRPDLVKKYTTTVEVIDGARVKADLPEIHTKCRARVLLVPAKEI
ncbi:YqaJ viral recombinase family protein [Streptomyces sp. NPDC057456]|uniref:YqaJ viral recombinase family nuclease n=1 Tax=Streptomyces sp. NPDC057456 TaxID=3346139 RepID=UPI003682A5B8